jgi:hypothetical protein
MAVLVPDPERHARRRDVAALLVGVAALIAAITVLVYVVWVVGASVRATPFDADGVRCYSRAVETVCLKTAEPPR